MSLHQRRESSILQSQLHLGIEGHREISSLITEQCVELLIEHGGNGAKAHQSLPRTSGAAEKSSRRDGKAADCGCGSEFWSRSALLVGKMLLETRPGISFDVSISANASVEKCGHVHDRWAGPVTLGQRRPRVACVLNNDECVLLNMKLAGTTEAAFVLRTPFLRQQNKPGPKK